MGGWAGHLPTPDVRQVRDMRGVLAAPDCRETGPLYYMYRDLALTPADREWLACQDLRYDITTLLARNICGERVKTKGHYHPSSPSGPGFPEVYEVLSGHAHYLLQARDLSDVVMVDAREGDIVVIPPGYGHVTINAGDSELIMANIVSCAFESEYGAYEKRRGAAYYEMADGVLIRNPAYGDIPDLRVVCGGRLREVLPVSTNGIYGWIGTDLLSFLNRPGDGTELYRQVLTG